MDFPDFFKNMKIYGKTTWSYCLRNLCPNPTAEIYKFNEFIPYQPNAEKGRESACKIFLDENTINFTTKTRQLHDMFLHVCKDNNLTCVVGLQFEVVGVNASVR